MKEAGDDHIFAFPSSDESRADLEKEGFVLIEIRRRNHSKNGRLAPLRVPPS